VGGGSRRRREQEGGQAARWEKEEEVGGGRTGGKLSEESIHLGLSSSWQRVFYQPFSTSHLKGEVKSSELNRKQNHLNRHTMVTIVK